MEQFIKEEDIQKYDSQQMHAVLEDFPEQVKDAIERAKNVAFEETPNCIVVAGMGGSAIAGDLLKSYLYSLGDLKIPLVVARDYKLPNFVNKDSLVFISFYSGNTEETLSMYNDAVKRSANIVLVTSGGKLKEQALKKMHKVIRVPMGLQPRCAIAYSFFPILKVLENSAIIDSKKDAVNHLLSLARRPVIKEKAIELAEKMHGRVPLIYASNILSSVAERWKTQINENTKMHAFYNVFSELDHNEILGFTHANADYYVTILRDVSDDRKMVKRMELTKEIIKKQGIPVTEMVVSGDCLMTRMFTTILIGDWTSYYLAIKKGVDPTPVKLIEELKKQLKS